jgi:hypothetical protein
LWSLDLFRVLILFAVYYTISFELNGISLSAAFQ